MRNTAKSIIWSSSSDSLDRKAHPRKRRHRRRPAPEAAGSSITVSSLGRDLRRHTSCTRKTSTASFTFVSPPNALATRAALLPDKSRPIKSINTRFCQWLLVELTMDTSHRLMLSKGEIRSSAISSKVDSSSHFIADARSPPLRLSFVLGAENRSAMPATSLCDTATKQELEALF